VGSWNPTAPPQRATGCGSRACSPDELHCAAAASFEVVQWLRPGSWQSTWATGPLTTRGKDLADAGAEVASYSFNEKSGLAVCEDNPLLECSDVLFLHLDNTRSLLTSILSRSRLSTSIAKAALNDERSLGSARPTKHQKRPPQQPRPA
jgi:hypothetical protein